ncbi:hypothetical protein ABE504_17305 [Paenibacillus oryzisoli]|nr:hypothetical protein [Paenibacillus whitsoniae]
MEPNDQETVANDTILASGLDIDDDEDDDEHHGAFQQGPRVVYR